MLGPLELDLEKTPTARAGRRMIAARLCARLLLGLAAAAAPLLGAAPAAYAQPKKVKSIVVVVEGQNAKGPRDDVLAIVPETLAVIDPDEFAAALKKAGQTKPVGYAVSVPKGRDKVLERIRKAAADVNAEAVVVGFVRTTRGRREIYLAYIDQIPGDLAVDEAIPLKAKQDERRAAIEAVLGPTLKEIAPPAEPKEADEPEEPKETVEKPPAEEPEEPAGPGRTPHEIGTALFSAELGFELGARWFGYSDGVRGELRDYDVFGAPMAAVAGEVYPAAGTGIPVLQDLGVTVGYARAFALESATEGGDPITTTYQRFQVGLRFRYPLGDASAPVLGLSGGLKLLSFSYDAPEELAEGVPDVSYTILRVGVDGRIPIGPVAIALGFDYLAPLSAGAVYDRFTGASVKGIGLAGGFIFPITSGVEVRMMAEYHRFFSSFAPEVPDPFVAGGALDEFLGLRLSGAYVY